MGFGVLRNHLSIWRESASRGFSWGYADGPYWILAKPTRIRVTWNQFAYTGGAADVRATLDGSGSVMREWQSGGDTIYVCPNNAAMHGAVIGEAADKWTSRVINELRKHTDRPIKVREKRTTDQSPEGVKKRERDMQKCFDGAWAIVVAGSNIGVEAVCRGVPAFYTHPYCALAAPGISTSDLSRIENPVRADDDARLRWAQNLAARQFSVEQMSSGAAWDQLEADLQHEEGRFVKRNILSWLEHTPFELCVYHEGKQPGLEHPRLVWRQWEDIPGAVEFVEEAAKSKAARGMFGNGYDYNYDAHKFSRKVYAQADAAEEGTEYLLWLDSDVEVLQPMLSTVLEDVMRGMVLGRYERPGYHSETGVVIWDMRADVCRQFFKHYLGLYQSRRIYTSPRGWHDCWALDLVVDALKMPTANLCEPGHYTPGSPNLHVMPSSALGRYMRHDKGSRKRAA
jgi:hypothetical protein